MADYQFREVTLYDMSVTFAENQEPEDQEAFLKGCAGTVQEALFLHESTADLTAGTRTKFVHFLASQEELSGFVSLHRGKEPVAFPEKGPGCDQRGAWRKSWTFRWAIRCCSTCQTWTPCR